MAEKKNNLAEGRLGIPSVTKPGPAGKGARKKSNYGVGRLGITSDSEQETPEQILESIDKQETTSSTRPDADRKERISQELQDIIAAHPHSDQADAIRQPDPPSEPVSKIIAATVGNRRKKIFILAGALGPIVVIGLVLLGWYCFSGEGASPQSASADVRSKPDGGGSKQASTDNAKRGGQARKKQPDTPMGPLRPVSADTPGRPAPGLDGSSTSLSKMTISQALKALAKLRRQKPRPDTPPPDPAPKRGVSPPKPDKPEKDDSSPKLASEVVAKTAAAARPDIELAGIMRGPDGKVALINNRFVKVGQTVNNAKIVKIRNFSVEVQFEGQVFLIGITTPPPPVDTTVEDPDEDESSDDDDDSEEDEEDET